MADNRLIESESKESSLRAVEFSAEGQGPKWRRIRDIAVTMQISMQNRHLFIWLVWPKPYSIRAALMLSVSVWAKHGPFKNRALICDPKIL